MTIASPRLEFPFSIYFLILTEWSRPEFRFYPTLFFITSQLKPSYPIRNPFQGLKLLRFGNMLSSKNQEILAPVKKNYSHSSVVKSWFIIMLVVSVEEVLFKFERSQGCKVCYLAKWKLRLRGAIAVSELCPFILPSTVFSTKATL